MGTETSSERGVGTRTRSGLSHEDSVWGLELETFISAAPPLVQALAWLPQNPSLAQLDPTLYRHLKQPERVPESHNPFPTKSNCTPSITLSYHAAASLHQPTLQGPGTKHHFQFLHPSLSHSLEQNPQLKRLEVRCTVKHSLLPTPLEQDSWSPPKKCGKV